MSSWELHRIGLRVVHMFHQYGNRYSIFVILAIEGDRPSVRIETHTKSMLHIHTRAVVMEVEIR